MNVAIMGTGLMGHPMAERLLESGHHVVAYNRTRGKAERLRAAGAVIAGTPEEAIRAAPCALLMLADAKAIRQVLLTPPVKRQLRNRTVIQMGRIGPRESQALLKQVKAAGLKLALNHLIAAEISALALSVGLMQREGGSVQTCASLHSRSFPKFLHRRPSRSSSSSAWRGPQVPAA